MSKKSGSSSGSTASPSGLPFVSHEMAGRFLAPLRLLGWATILFTALELSSVAFFSLKLKNVVSEWVFFTMCAERAWGYLLLGLALTLVVPAGPIRKWELMSLRLSHYLCAIFFVGCLVLAPIGWTRWDNHRRDIIANYAKEQRKADALYRQTQLTLENETTIERLTAIAKVAGLLESVKTITNTGEMNAELQRRLKIERDEKQKNLNEAREEASNAHKMALVRSMGALVIATICLGMFWWFSRASRQQLMMRGENRNSSSEYFPYA